MTVAVMPQSQKQIAARKLKKPELLAPAGSLEKLKYAVHYGADAVYIGGQKYGLRSNADNFTLDEMREGVLFARQHGAKVFVAANIYAHNEDLPGVEQYLRGLQDAGISAVIVADPAIIEIAKRAAPNVEVHLSTQQSVMNWMAVQFWKDEGLPRVVLAREVSLTDIKEIKRRVGIEIEAFIHGAMCSSYSGRCVLSNHFTDRDSNRGGCSQSCRWKYDLLAPGDVPLVQAAAEEDKFTMGSKDLGMIEHIPELVDAGIDSFKIEGRMKSLHYVASVVHAYRQAIDSYCENPGDYRLKQVWREEIHKAANRPLNTGFYYQPPDADDHIYGPISHRAPGAAPGANRDKELLVDFAGVVLEYDERTGFAVIEQRNHFKTGQTIEFFGPEGTKFKQTVKEIYNEAGERLDAARHPLQRIRMRVEQPVRLMDIMRKWVR